MPKIGLPLIALGGLVGVAALAIMSQRKSRRNSTFTGPAPQTPWPNFRFTSGGHYSPGGWPQAEYGTGRGLAPGGWPQRPYGRYLGG